MKLKRASESVSPAAAPGGLPGMPEDLAFGPEGEAPASGGGAGTIIAVACALAALVCLAAAAWLIRQNLELMANA